MNSENLDTFITDIESNQKYSAELLNIFKFINNEMSDELPILSIDTDYFILAMLLTKNIAHDILEDTMLSSDLESLRDVYQQYIVSKSLSAVKPNRKKKLSSDLIEVLEKAEKILEKLQHTGIINSSHVLLAILSEDNPSDKSRKIFKRLGITYEQIYQKVLSQIDIKDLNRDFLDSKNKGVRFITTNPDGTYEDDDDDTPKLIFTPIDKPKRLKKPVIPYPQDIKIIEKGIKQSSEKSSDIDKYCINLNKLAEMGKIDKLIGRVQETHEIIQILGRKKKHNPVIVGGEGIGKTAIIENIANLIVEGNVPNFMADKVIYSLDMTALTAGTTLRGMFESRVYNILNEIKRRKNCILFIDNIGNVFSSNSEKDSYDIGAMLSHSLENGELQVMGTASFSSFRKTFDKNPNLARRFQKIIIEPSSAEDSEKILNGIKESYESYHNVKYTDKALTTCVKLAERYITEKNLPDSAIDIMDEIGALKGTLHDNPSLRKMKKELNTLSKEIDSLKVHNDYTTADEKSKELIEKTKEYNHAKEIDSKESKKKPPIITEDDILELISNKTKIPITNLTTDEINRLENIDKRLKEEVIGQDEAIDTVTKAIKRNRVGLYLKGCMFSALFAGSTGSGKTLLAKKLAKEIFGDEKALIRFDMSEYPDKSAVNKLIGSNPGYIGYEEGGQLTEAVKNKKHCVLLLDEIEKADPEVYNIFLQVLDEGFLTDNSGMKVDFKNVIIIFTSNIGAKEISDFGNGIGFGNTDETSKAKRIFLKALKNRFPPEFINRLDNVIYFNKLSNTDIQKIIKIELEKLKTRLNTLNYNVSFDDSMIDYIATIVQDEKEYGARPIIRAIQDNVEDVLTDNIIQNKLKKDMTPYLLKYENDKVELVSK